MGNGKVRVLLLPSANKHMQKPNPLTFAGSWLEEHGIEHMLYLYSLCCALGSNLVLSVHLVLRAFFSYEAVN